MTWRLFFQILALLFFVTMCVAALIKQYRSERDE